MLKISLPVLENLANDTLKAHLPNTNPKCHKNALLEAFGRTACGISPWLELDDLKGEERKMQETCRRLFHKALANATNPKANDYMIIVRRRRGKAASGGCGVFMQCTGKSTQKSGPQYGR